MASLKLYFRVPAVLCIVIIQTVSADSLFQQYELPPLERVPKTHSVNADYLTQSRVLRRAHTLPVSFSQIEDVDAYKHKVRASLNKFAPVWPTAGQQLLFSGHTFSELNQKIEALPYDANTPLLITISNERLTADEPLLLRSNMFVNGRGVTIVSTLKQAAINITNNANSVVIKHFVFDDVYWPISIGNAQRILISELLLKNATWGIVVRDRGRYIGIDRIQASNTHKTAILLQGDISDSLVSNSDIFGGRSSRNGNAAIVVTDALNNGYSTLDQISNNAALSQPIWPVSEVPHRILITGNRLYNNKAQGIYLDGANGIMVTNNTILDNDKEGVCLDFGSSQNIVVNNHIARNGDRNRQTDDDLKTDLVFNFGRLADGSAVSKLPGIALDNAAYNIIMMNAINDNAGDGIKIVRTGLRNFLLFNSIVNNDTGHNSQFQFFGVLLGAAGAEPEINVDASHPLDFMPPIENVVAGNLIYGKHRSAILLDKGAAFNDIYDNIARQYIVAPFESASKEFNSVVGNSWPDSPDLRHISFWARVKNRIKVYWESI